MQAKIQELMALQLAPILAQSDGLQPYPRLKAQTIVRIHHARDILLSRLENPPLIPELAQLVGVSDRTLGNGFRELFGTTVFGYLTSKRMEQAEQLLRSGKLTVTQVANLVGYAQQGHFAIAFKRKFGITPVNVCQGKKYFRLLMPFCDCNAVLDIDPPAIASLYSANIAINNICNKHFN
ncbi:AraC family transcriptional regulator [Nostoc sp. NMS9]|uniref:helix-turn-helix transcriptional regulator n=1 Tax=Nostoc sp. NMS9 TaxID=2815393 RepID=UPI002600810D|nr:AraC family transcriptional regulator [Nostoc sp. NMS9]